MKRIELCSSVFVCLFVLYMHILPLFQLHLIQDALLYFIFSFLLTNHLNYYLKQPRLDIMPLFLFPGKTKTKTNTMRMCSEQRRKAEDEREKETGLKREKRTENINIHQEPQRKKD